MPDHSLFKLSPLALALLLPLGGAQANEGTNKAEADKPLERISVTGTRISRADLEGVTNVATITADDMVKSGFNTVYDALSNLSSANGAIIGEVETGSYTPGAKELNLRGIGPEYTLILVNGKRLAYYPMPYGGQTNFVNLDMIPTAMVERIDIQTGGASAVYGSEAMAGVINIITKKGIEGHYIDAEAGIDTYNSNPRQMLSFVGGFANEGWTLDYALEYKGNEGLYASDRPYHDSVWDNPNPKANRELNRSITVYSSDTPYINNYADKYCNTADNPHPRAVAHYISRNNYGMSCGWDETGDNHLINQNESFSGYLNTEYELSENAQLFANGFFITQEKKGARGVLLFNDTQFVDPDLIDKDGNQGAVVKYMWRKVLDSEYTSDGLGRTYDDQSYSVNAGLKGLVGDFDYSLTLSRSEYDFSDEYMHATKAGFADLLGPQLGTHEGLPVHRPDYKYWFGAFDAAKMSRVADWVTYTGNSFNNTFTADIAGDLFELPAGPLSFAAYIEVMEEGTSSIPDERVLNKGFSGLTGVITEGSRNRYAAATEVLVPVLDNLEVQGALRYDFYDDDSNVGGAFSSQLGFTYRPVESLVLRSAAGTTFRGPDMAAIYKGFSGNFGMANDRLTADACKTLAQTGAAPGYDVDALTLSCADADLTSDPSKPSLSANYESISSGDKTLKEETGTTFTTGLVYEFSEALSFNLDYYDITIKDKIQALDPGYIVNTDYECRTGVYDSNSELCQNMASRIVRYDANGKGVDYLGNSISGNPYLIHTVTGGYINAAERQDAGIDFGFEGYIPSTFGDWRYDVSLTQVLKKKERLREGDELLDLLDSQNNFDFKTMASAQLGWTKDNTAVSLLASYKGEMWNNANYGERERLPGWTRFNLTIGQRLGEDTRLLFSVTNLFNAMPPQDETFSSFPFYRTGSYDTLGRQFSLRVTHQF
ncbi:TonB-dependent receptor [Shewanella sp. JM162201]|uniref:TonB-dependent receptor n=1 Tax=Shewanella jiangmenensis TaxID=2837387 RepID=A0ABS5V1S0_9GAMM|nr:TonB-dependent receptor [Shewanella jiangmenensis]MBT1444415.1 TonB-dependent receptor [Shewanella jiangmenensis]